MNRPLVAAPAAGGRGHLLAFAALSASYFAHIGFFNPYLPLWLKDLGLPIFVISLLTSVQSVTRVFAPYAWGALSDHTGERVKLLRFSAAVALVVMEHALRNRAQCGDVHAPDLPEHPSPQASFL